MDGPTSSQGGMPGKAERQAAPWLSILFRPRRTIRAIVDTNPRYGVLPLAAAAGGAEILMQGVDLLLQLNLPLANAVAISAAVGAVLGLIGLYLFGWLYRWVGSWFGGQATYEEVRAAIAWAETPVFIAFGVWLAMFVLARSPDGIAKGAGVIVAIGVGFVALAAWISRVVLACHTLGEVHRFSAWKGFGTLLIPNALMMIPVAFIGLLSAISIPNILRGRMVANESAAIGNLRSLVASLEMYRSVNDGYPASAEWSKLYPSGDTSLGTPGFQTDGALMNHRMMAHRYTYSSEGASQYQITAVPAESTKAGRSFYADDSTQVRHCTTQASAQQADADDAEIDQPARPCD